MIYFLDTNICIYYLKGRDAGLRDKLDAVSTNNIKLPSIVAAELLLEAEKSISKDEKMPIFEAYIGIYDVVPFDGKAAAIYARIRAGLEKRNQLIGPNDLIIAATVIANNGTLITHNMKEFTRVQQLIAEDWCG